MACPFCGDVDGREEDRLVCGNDLVFCLVNFEPLKPGHVMVIPRRHITRVSELTPEESHAMHYFVDRMVDAVEAAYPEEGTPAIRVNHGAHKSQPHLHYHVLPSRGDLRDHFVAFEGVSHRERKPRDVLVAIAKHLRDALS